MADTQISLPPEITTPITPWPQSPSLLPNTGQGVAVVGGLMQLQGENEFLTTFPRTVATATATIAGAVANGDSLRLTITHPAVGAQVANITAATGDTVSNLVEKFITAIDALPALQNAGIFATGLLGVLTLNAPGALGNFVSWTRTIVSGSETITLSAATLSGGAGPIIPAQGFSVVFGGMNYWFKANQPRNVDITLLAVLANGGYPIY